MQYLARGRYGVEEPAGAGVRVERTNSGEGILLMCSRKAFFHGAGPEGARCTVVDIVRIRRTRCWKEFEAIVAVVWGLFKAELIDRN